MRQTMRIFEAPEGKESHAKHHQEGDEVFNQDGSRLGGGGGQVINPTAHEGQLMVNGEFVHPPMSELPIGGADPLLREDANTREMHPGISGGAAPSDYGTSGALQGDASNVGLEGD